MKPNQYKIKSKVWLYPGMAGWHFVTLPQDISEDIKVQFKYFKRGWGSIPVIATIGRTRWKTSIFPDKKSNSYVIPIKSDVRKKEKVFADDEVEIMLEVKE